MGIQERRQKEKEMRKNDIVDAGERVFFSKGYEKATMDEVAKEAEFSKKTVYSYLSSKEELYFEIMIRGYKLLIRMFQDDLQKQKRRNAIEELNQMFLTFYQFSNENSNYFRAIMEYETGNKSIESAISDQTRDECYTLGEKILDYLTSILEKGMTEGTICSRIDARKTALVLWAFTVGIFNTVKKKEQYLIDFHNTMPDSFMQAGFELMMRSIQLKSEGGMYENEDN